MAFNMCRPKTIRGKALVKKGTVLEQESLPFLAVLLSHLVVYCRLARCWPRCCRPTWSRSTPAR